MTTEFQKFRGRVLDVETLIENFAGQLCQKRLPEYLQPGQPLGLLRVVDPLELPVEVSATVRLALKVGTAVDVELLDVDHLLLVVERDLLEEDAEGQLLLDQGELEPAVRPSFC